MCLKLHTTEPWNTWGSYMFHSMVRCCILKNTAIKTLQNSNQLRLDLGSWKHLFFIPTVTHPKYYLTHIQTQWIFDETFHSLRLKAPTRKAIVSAVASPSASGSFTKPPARTSTKASPRMWKRMGEQVWWKQQHFSKGSKVWFNIVVYQLSSFWETLHILFSTLMMLSFQSFGHPAILEQALPRMIDFVHQGAMRDMKRTYCTHQHTCHCLGWRVKAMQKKTPLFRFLTFSNFHLLFDRFQVFLRINIDFNN